VSSILTHVRKGRILDVFAIENGMAEVMEGEVLETSPLAGKTLSEGTIPDGVGIGAIIRDNVVLKPTPDLVIRNKDRVVLSAEKSDLKYVEQLFRVSLDYF